MTESCYFCDTHVDTFLFEGYYICSWCYYHRDYESVFAWRNYIKEESEIKEKRDDQNRDD